MRPEVCAPGFARRSRVENAWSWCAAFQACYSRRALILALTLTLTPTLPQVRSIPNVLLAAPHALLEQLRSAADGETVEELTRRATAAAAEVRRVVHGGGGDGATPGRCESTPSVLRAAAEALGLAVEVTWAEEVELLDAAFALPEEGVAPSEYVRASDTCRLQACHRRPLSHLLHSTPC